MTNFCANLRHPIDDVTASLLARLAVTAKGLGIDLLLVGAFYHMHGIETGIRTMDTDLSVRVSGWASFNRLRSALERADFRLIGALIEGLEPQQREAK